MPTQDLRDLLERWNSQYARADQRLARIDAVATSEAAAGAAADGPKIELF